MLPRKILDVAPGFSGVASPPLRCARRCTVGHRVSSATCATHVISQKSEDFRHEVAPLGSHSARRRAALAGAGSFWYGMRVFPDSSSDAAVVKALGRF